MPETALTRDAGIRVPLICGAMYPCSNPELVAAVSEAGGIGIVQPMSLVYVHGHDFLEGMALIRSLTSKPVGMNVILETSSKLYMRRMRDLGGAVDRGRGPLLRHVARQSALGRRTGPCGGRARLSRRHRGEVGAEGARQWRRRPDRGEQQRRRPCRAIAGGDAARDPATAGPAGRRGGRCRRRAGVRPPPRPRIRRRAAGHPLHRHQGMQRAPELQGRARPGHRRRHRADRARHRRSPRRDQHAVRAAHRHPGRTPRPA